MPSLCVLYMCGHMPVHVCTCIARCDVIPHLVPYLILREIICHVTVTSGPDRHSNMLNKSLPSACTDERVSECMPAAEAGVLLGPEHLNDGLHGH